MLHLLTGTNASEKKEYIFECLSEMTEGDGRVFLVVPEQSSFDRDREFLFRYGERISNRLTVTSFTNLTRDILEEYGLKSKPDADEAARSVLMSLAVEEVSDSLSIYNRHLGKSGLIRELLTEYAEIKQAGFSPSDLRDVSAGLEKGTLKMKTDELSRIFSAYDSLITDRFSEKTDNLTTAVRYMAEHAVFADAVLWFYDFRGFTGVQLQFLRELLSQAREVFVAVNMPEFVSGDEADGYEHALRTARSLRHAAASANVPVRVLCTDTSSADDPLSVLRSSLYSYEPEIFDKPAPQITVMRAQNKYSEADMIACEIRRLIEEEHYRCSEIAVTERSDAYAGALKAALRKYGVPVFEDKRNALCDYPLVKAVLNAVRLSVYGFDSETVFALIKTGMIGISAEECAQLENYVYLWQIDSYQWTRPFEENPSGFGEERTKEDEETLSRVDALREKLIRPLLTLKNELEKRSGEASCRAVYTYLRTVEADKNFCEYARFLNANGREDEALQCASVWDSVMESLDALHGALGSRAVPPARFFELLKIILSSEDIGKIPAGIDEIVIGSADRMRYSGIRVLFAAGVNEGVFPLSAEPGGLFTAKERRELNSRNFTLENLPENIYAEERYIAWLTLTAPTEKIYLSYASNSIAGEVLAPSELITRVRNIFPYCRFVDEEDLSSLDRIGSPETAFEQYAAHSGENTAEKASMEEYLLDSGLFAGRIASLTRAVGKTPASFNDPGLSLQLFGERMYMSPSKAEMYHKCPFMFFCRYGMGLQKLRTASLDARINGLLVHHVLEKMLDTFSNAELTAQSPDRIREETDRLTEEYIDNYMGGREGKSRSFNKSLDRVKDTVYEILMRMIAEFGTSLFETKDVELTIGADGEIAPYVISLPDGGSLTIGGQIDRVDVMEDGGLAYVRVIDYKTGGKDFKLSDVFDGLNMQMLIYLMCLWDNGGKKYGKIVPAGILYVPAKTSGQNVDRRAGPEEIAKQKIENGRMNGLLLENEMVLKAMDPEAQGKYIKASIDKNGRLKGNFLSLDGFVKLHKKIDSVLTETAMSLHGGRIEALPVLDGHYKMTCQYCDYKDVCLREEDDACRKLSDMDHDKAVRRLFEEEGTDLG